VPALLTPIVLRMTTSSQAQIILFSFAFLTLISNGLATWIEQIILRFAARNVYRALLWIVLSESAVVIIGFPAIIAIISQKYPQTSVLYDASVWNLAICIGLDVIYRTLIAIVQMRGAASVFTITNIIRAVLEIGAVILALFLSCQAHGIIIAMVAARLTSCIFASLPVISIYRNGKVQEVIHKSWVRYGLILAGWFWLQQLFIYIPQWYSVIFQDTIGSVSFLAFYRVLVQGGLLLAALLLLYMHPRLMNAYEEQGRSGFEHAWLKWWAPYIVFTALSSVIMCGAFPFVCTFIMTPKYSLDLVAFLCVVPGIFAWSISQYVQKILEAERRVFSMLIGLSVGIVFTVCTLHIYSYHPFVGIKYAQTAGLAISLGFSVYLVWVTFSSQRCLLGGQGQIHRILRTVGLCGISSILSIVIALILRFKKL
jgi:hypothetical protein